MGGEASTSYCISSLHISLCVASASHCLSRRLKVDQKPHLGLPARLLLEQVLTAILGTSGCIRGVDLHAGHADPQPGFRTPYTSASNTTANATLGQMRLIPIFTEVAFGRFIQARCMHANCSCKQAKVRPSVEHKQYQCNWQAGQGTRHQRGNHQIANAMPSATATGMKMVTAVGEIAGIS